MRFKMTFLLTLLTLLALTTGCIIGDTTHRLYIDPSGAVSWVVLERDLRSASASEEKRRSEEGSLLSNTEIGQHSVARAFDLLSPTAVEYRILRSQRPYAVWTEAQFPSIDDLAHDLLRELAVDATVKMWTQDDITHLRITVDATQDHDGFEDDTILALAEDLEDYRLLMTTGRFVDAVGFRLEEEGTVAIPLEYKQPEGEEATEPIVLSLSWLAH